MITARKEFGSYVLTKVDFDAITNVDDETPLAAAFTSKCAINENWVELELLSIVQYNHDTSLFKFRLPKGALKLQLPVGGFLLVLAPDCEHGGGDAVRPYTNIADDDLNLVPEGTQDSSAEGVGTTGTFEILCKRYDQWGKRESIHNNFLFTKTNHSYRPAGAVSNYIHRLQIGNTVKFKHNLQCRGKLNFPAAFKQVRQIMMIAVGVGVAPMIQTLRSIFKIIHQQLTGKVTNKSAASMDVVAGGGSSGSMDEQHEEDDVQSLIVEKVVLLYGVRTVEDILLRELLEEWQETYADIFQVVYCVGSRWANVHWGAKSKEEYKPPPPPPGFSDLKYKELGWVSEEKIAKYGCAPTSQTKVLVCGLPGVYDKLCGPRNNREVAPNSVLHRLGYTDEMVVKL